MSGRGVVTLRKIPPGCPSCGAETDVYTARALGTVIRYACDPYTCRIARILILAGTTRAAPVEPLPLDDRDQLRRPLLAGVA